MTNDTTTQGRSSYRLATLLVLVAMPIIGQANATDMPSWTGDWTLYQRERSGQSEIVRGLSKTVCETIKDDTLKQPGPRGPSGMPIVGHVSPSEIEVIECLSAEVAPPS